ncbi:MerR family transcriptional regulator [Streptomyces alboflavus]|uniref:hypothetical protein n=1 Tax=Streptomyces alboflavus TaxID=67267 RepID=UPI00369C2535
MTIKEIADLCGVDRTAPHRWAKSGQLGEQLNPGGRPARYARAAVLEAGKTAGYLDGRGRRVERDPASRRRPVPQSGRSAATGKVLFFVPDVAAMFGVDEGLVSVWANRGRITKGGDEQAGENPAWWMTTLRELARTSDDLHLDEKARRPA